MFEPDRGTWWRVAPDGDRVVVSHGLTLDGEPQPPAAVIGVSLPAALELAVGLVHAALDIDSEATQATMLRLWVREQ